MYPLKGKVFEKLWVDLISLEQGANSSYALFHRLVLYSLKEHTLSMEVYKITNKISLLPEVIPRAMRGIYSQILKVPSSCIMYDFRLVCCHTTRKYRRQGISSKGSRGSNCTPALVPNGAQSLFYHIWHLVLLDPVTDFALGPRSFKLHLIGGVGMRPMGRDCWKAELINPYVSWDFLYVIHQTSKYIYILCTLQQVHSKRSLDFRGLTIRHCFICPMIRHFKQSGASYGFGLKGSF